MSGLPPPERSARLVEPRPGRVIDLTDQAAVPADVPGAELDRGRREPVGGGRRWARRILFAIVAIVGLAAAYWLVTLAQVIAAADDDEARPVDAIVVLGAAQFDGTPSPVLAARLDRALELYRAGHGSVVMTTGSNREGDRFTEGFSGFVYLREAGVPEAAILTIVHGADTYQQLTAAQNQLVARDLHSVLLVSDGYHTHRLRGIAGEIGLEAYVAPSVVEGDFGDRIREATAVSLGRIFGYRRLSAWNTG